MKRAETLGDMPSGNRFADIAGGNPDVANAPMSALKAPQSIPESGHPSELCC
jgi:hypothetical protein